MAINYTNGQTVYANTNYISSTLSSNTSTIIRATLQSLGLLGTSGVTVAATGSVFTGSTTLSYIRVTTSDSQSPIYNGGTGITLYFENDTQLNNSLQLFSTQTVFYGTGNPQGVQTADVGSVYRQLDGLIGTSTWIKEVGTGSVGWAPFVTGAIAFNHAGPPFNAYGLGQWNAPSTSGTNTNVASAFGTKWTYTSATTQNSQAYLLQGASTLTASLRPWSSQRFAISSTTNERFFNGSVEWATSAAAVTNLAFGSSTPAQPQAGLTYDTDRGDTTFKWVENDGVTLTVTDTGVAPDAAATYWLEIDMYNLSSFKIYLLSGDRTSLLSSHTFSASPFLSTTNIAMLLGVRNLGDSGLGQSKAIVHYVVTQIARAQ